MCPSVSGLSVTVGAANHHLSRSMASVVPTAEKLSRILIVGAGLTGSAITKFIQESAVADHVVLEVWEKSRGAGGRAATHRWSQGTVDTGLQYLSTSSSDTNVIYQEMVDANVITPMTSRIGGKNSKYTDPSLSHYTVRNGASSLAKHLLGNFNPKYNKELESLHLVSVDGQEIWRATTKAGDTTDFDGVVLTPPMQQILSIGGEVIPTIEACGADLLSELQAISYSSRWALGLRFSVDAWDLVSTFDWDARYVTKDENPAICYVAVDQLKRGLKISDLKQSGEGPTLLVHAGVPWSLKNHASTPKDEEPVGMRDKIQANLMSECKALLPDLMASHETTEIKLHKWKFSQVYKGSKTRNGVVVVQPKPLLLLTGDGLTDASGFDKCMQAATSASDTILSNL